MAQHCNSSEFFRFSKGLNMLFLSLPPTQFCRVLCLVYAQEETAFTCFQPLAQGDWTFIHSWEQHNDRHRTYKADKLKKKYIKNNTIKDEEVHRLCKTATTVIFLHSSLTTCIFRIFWTNARAHRRAGQYCQSPLKSICLKRSLKTPEKQSSKFPAMLTSFLLHQ